MKSTLDTLYKHTKNSRSSLGWVTYDKILWEFPFRLVLFLVNLFPLLFLVSFSLSCVFTWNGKRKTKTLKEEGEPPAIGLDFSKLSSNLRVDDPNLFHQNYEGNQERNSQWGDAVDDQECIKTFEILTQN